VVVVAAAGVAVAVTGPFGGAGHAGGGPGAGGYPTSLSTVTRGVLRSQTSVPTLGYAGSYTVTGHGGTVTWLPAPGQIIGQGQVLYRVNNGTPVVLLYGRVPAWRALTAGVHGADVRQLNHALVALGCATRALLDPASKYFTDQQAQICTLASITPLSCQPPVIGREDPAAPGQHTWSRSAMGLGSGEWHTPGQA